MSRNKDNPSGKPSVSRLSLGKKTPSGSIAIRFNAASMNDDDDDYDDDLSLTSVGSKSRGDSVKFEVTKDKSQVYSLSAPTSGPSSPDSSSAPGDKVLGSAPIGSNDTTPVSGEKSILSGLKERFQDKLPEPINAIIEKIEVLKESSPDDVKRKMQKSESQDSESSLKLAQSDSVERIAIRKSESMDSPRGMPSGASPLRSSMHEISSKNRSRQSSTEKELPAAADDPLLKTDSCMEVVEDYYYNEEASDESLSTKFSTSSMGKSSSSEPLGTKPKSSLRKLISHKDRGSSPSRSSVRTSMTLSGLLSSKSDDSIHSHTTTPSHTVTASEKTEAEQFYDIESEEKTGPERPDKLDLNQSKSVPEETHSIDVYKFISVAVCVVACLIVPMPTFVSGLVFGACVTYTAMSLYHWMFAPPKPKEAFVVPDVTSLPPLVVPEMRESKNVDGKFQAWMNELQSYNPDDYHINLTASVFVTLEGTTLRLQRPKVNVSKRAMWDEAMHNPTFVHQRHFELKGSRIFLEPAGLVRKRLWSKKYPICIALPNGKGKSSTDLKKETDLDSGGAAPAPKDSVTSSSDREKKLIAQASLDEDKIRSSERRERRLPEQRSFDETRLQQLSSEHVEIEHPLKDSNSSAKKLEVESEDDKSEKESLMGGYEFVTREECDTKILYLFGRTGREKEEWFRRFTAASQGTPWPTRLSDLVPRINAASAAAVEVAPPRAASPSRPTSPTEPPPPSLLLQKRHSSSSIDTLPSNKQHQRQGSADSATFSPPEPSSPVTDTPPTSTVPPTAAIKPCPNHNIHEAALCEYLRSMAVVLPAGKRGPRKSSRATSPVNGAPRERAETPPGGYGGGGGARERCEPHCVWVNTLITRCFWDFLREGYWNEHMKQKIQRKLSKIHVPFFIDELTVTDISLGSEMPFVLRMSTPHLDDRGLWLDMDVAYSGGFQMSLETKVNLMKLKKEQPQMQIQRQSRTPRRSAVLNEDEEDSAESSTDDEAEVTTYVASDVEASGGSTGKKLLRLVDKLTQSKYFQQATENKYVKRAMKGVSNTPLMLNVELRHLLGTLTVNIPPPPTDRIWYGFRGNPKLWLSAKPKVGERAVTVTHVTEWIEKKLALEFQRVFVMPNMDDLLIPLMCDHIPDNAPAFESAV